MNGNDYKIEIVIKQMSRGAVENFVEDLVSFDLEALDVEVKLFERTHDDQWEPIGLSES